MALWGLCLAIFIGAAGLSHAHSGGLNASGCHNNRKTGEYHCHQPQNNPEKSLVPNILKSQDTYYKNCSHARAAGVTPILRGEPGYASHLDRDNDGIACESRR